jgi:hypothetical protein
MAERPIEIARHSVQGDGLIQQMVTRGALHLNCEMVPRIVVWVARDTCGGPMRTLVIPNVHSWPPAMRRSCPQMKPMPPKN